MTEWLSRFVEDNFTQGCPVNLNDLTRLVVDGESICSHLYSLLLQHKPGPWHLGGEYLAFHSVVKEFFTELLFTGLKVSVVLASPDLLDDEWQSLESAYTRGTRANKSLMHAQGRLGRQDAQKIGFMPVTVTYIFVDVLRRLDIELRVAEGVISRTVAAIANHYKCPVLAASPDYFMFALNAGYMPVEKLSTVIASGVLYRVSDLEKQFALKDPKLRLVLPALFGNAFISRLRAEEDFEQILKEVSKYDTPEAYLADRGEDVRKNFDTATKFYCDLPSQSDHTLDGGELFTTLLSDFPDWVAHKFKEGQLDLRLLGVYRKRCYSLGLVVEHIWKDSAWLTSRPLRQIAYGLMGVGEKESVTEFIRARSSPEVIETLVTPSNLDPPLHVREFVDKGKRALADILLQVLMCRKVSQTDIRGDFDILEDQWKLPVAATFYWYQVCDSPSAQRHLVKSLLLSFLVCSGELDANISTPPEQVTRDTKSDHMSALHVFAQWQCVYHDAMTLNHLTREPFFSTSPAYLFSGRVAMHCASYARRNQNLDGVVPRGTKGWELYNRFLYLVTGCDAEGRRGRHAKHQPKPKGPPLVKEQAPSLPKTNRYALLSDTEMA